MFKIDNAFRALIKFDDIAWCSNMRNFKKMSKSYRFLKPLLEDMKVVAPKLLQPCPFVGVLNLIDVPPPEKLTSVIPAGEYLSTVRVKDMVRNFRIALDINFIKIP